MQELGPLQKITLQPMFQQNTSSQGTHGKHPPLHQLQQGSASPGGSCVLEAALLCHCQYTLEHPEWLSLNMGQ